MIGLDTNVLVRYLARYDGVQSLRATQIIERRLSEDRPAFISLVTLVETVWVLDRVYGLSNREIAAAIEGILQADTLLVQNEQEAFYCNDRPQDRNWILLGRAHRGARRLGRMHSYAHIR